MSDVPATQPCMTMLAGTRHSLSTVRNVSWLWENSVNGTLEVPDWVVRGHVGGFSLRRLPAAPSPYLDMLEVKMTVSHRSDPSQTLKIGMEKSGKVSFFSLVAFLNWTFTIRAI